LYANDAVLENHVVIGRRDVDVTGLDAAFVANRLQQQQGLSGENSH
jgi:hypothetical protein